MLTESVIEYEGRRLVFPKPLVVQIRGEKGRITLEIAVGISGSGSDFESAWKNFRIEIFRRWNDPVMKVKQFLPVMVDREEIVQGALGFKQTTDREDIREVA